MLTISALREIEPELESLDDKEIVEVRDSIHALAGLFVDSVLATSQAFSESEKKHYALNR